MSQLLNVLKGKWRADAELPLSSKKNIKEYTSSISDSVTVGGGLGSHVRKSIFKPSGEDSISESITMTGSGPHIRKRRLAEISTLGVPEWYAGDPPPPPAMPGTAPPPTLPAYTMSHSIVMHATGAGDKPWLGLVLYNHAPETSPIPIYHNAATIKGEVRMILEKPTNLGSIDVWFNSFNDNDHRVMDILNPPAPTMTATLWNRDQGDPTVSTTDGVRFKGKFPVGTFVFPFEFPALPTDTPINHPLNGQSKDKARVPLPPTYAVGHPNHFSGNIKYIVGVNVTREGFTSINEEFEAVVDYLPLAHAIPRVELPFPYLATREDWPFVREVVGGWTLTPFGGRGRLGEEPVELEGLLGIQEPAVYAAGQTLSFTLLLWSASALALQALAQPGAIEVGFYKSDIYGPDAVYPKNSVRKQRKLDRLAGGRVWLADAGRPAEGDPMPAVTFVELPQAGGSSSAHVQQAYDSEAPTFEGYYGGSKLDDEDASLEALDALPHPDAARVVRLDGEVRIPTSRLSSFRYKSMAREYVLLLLIRHPQYTQVSPRTTGIIAECPVWYVLERQFQGQGTNHAALPVKGTTIPVGDGAVRLSLRTGHVTTEKRPTSRPERIAGF
ncbi:hypothetical protein B0H19DRAFT_1258903 [Mycena capillaripes]|nr:hypothetical protein B0H19DRAFT_1258903 [Mycena capillaripes]